MTDRELLELAAKAAGIEIKVSEVDGTTLYTRDSSVGWRIWNPRDDEGDALRLAVRTNMQVYPDAFNGDTQVICCETLATPLHIVTEPHNGDPYAATCLAIVRAAAEIGWYMK